MENEKAAAVPQRINEGYVIIKTIQAEDTEIVLGKMETRFNTMYVTWQCDEGNNDYLGALLH